MLFFSRSDTIIIVRLPPYTEEMLLEAQKQV